MVRSADLDLNTADGAARLHQRVKRAATKVCGAYYPADLRARANVMTCRSGALASASNDAQIAVAAARQAQAMQEQPSRPAL